MRSQASLELLVVMAALFAFFAAFMPLIREVVEAAQLSVAVKTNEAAFSHLNGLAREAYSMGAETELNRAVKLAGTGLFSFNDSTGLLAMNFSSGRKIFAFNEKVSFSFRLNKTSFASGYYSVKVMNNGKVVEAVIDSSEETP